jgi:hypothetical protein
MNICLKGPRFASESLNAQTGNGPILKLTRTLEFELMVLAKDAGFNGNGTSVTKTLGHGTIRLSGEAGECGGCPWYLAVKL